MYAVTSIPLESRTRSTFRRAEFGFFGVIVLTTVQTPRFCGQPCMAGCFGFDFCGTRGERINWLIVGIPNPKSYTGRISRHREQITYRSAARRKVASLSLGEKPTRLASRGRQSPEARLRVLTHPARQLTDIVVA